MRLSLVCVLFDPAIPTSFFNFIQLFLYLYNVIPMNSFTCGVPCRWLSRNRSGPCPVHMTCVSRNVHLPVSNRAMVIVIIILSVTSRSWRTKEERSFTHELILI